MPRNSGGAYSLPSGNPVVGHTLATSTWANTTMSDLAAEMTDSLDRSGKGGMLAPLLLVNGAVGTPAIAFTSESGTGLYRAAAGDLRAALQGADSLRLTSAGVFSGAAGAGAFLGSGLSAAQTANQGLTLTGNKVAADAGSDVSINSSVTRTAGFLLNVFNNGTAKFYVGFGGNLYTAGGRLTTETANQGLVLAGNKVAADAGTDITLDTAAIRTAGFLLNVFNNGTAKFYVGFDGNLYTASGRLTTETANQGLVLTGNKVAADAGADILLDSIVLRTAGYLLQVRNFGTAKFYVGFDGNLYTASGRLTTETANQGLVLTGNKVAADAGDDVTVDTVNLRTAGTCFVVRNQGLARFYVDFAGTFVGQNGLANLYLQPVGQLISTYSGNSGITLRGNRNAADSGQDIIFDTVAVRTGGANIFSFRNGGTQVLGIDTGGNLAAGNNVYAGGGGGTGVFLGSAVQANATANQSLNLIGNRNAGDAGTDLVLRSAATRTAGLLLDAQNNGTSKATLDFAGKLVTVGAAAHGYATSSGNGLTVTPDAQLANTFLYVATGTLGWTINAPTSPTAGQHISITLRNTSGGAVTNVSWNAVFKGQFNFPANAQQTTAEWFYDGTNWVQVTAPNTVAN